MNFIPRVPNQCCLSNLSPGVIFLYDPDLSWSYVQMFIFLDQYRSPSLMFLSHFVYDPSESLHSQLLSQKSVHPYNPKGPFRQHREAGVVGHLALVAGGAHCQAHHGIHGDSRSNSGWWCNNHLEKYESQWENYPICYGT